jgi:hypothetical protein
MPRHAARRREATAAMTGAPEGSAEPSASLAGAGFPVRLPCQAQQSAPARAAAWPELRPAGRALAWLRSELAVRGLAATGMTITRLQGTLTLADGLTVQYRDGWLFWPAGRLSSSGRPLHAIHPAGRSSGAARRLAVSRPGAAALSAGLSQATVGQGVTGGLIAQYGRARQAAGDSDEPTKIAHVTVYRPGERADS